MTMHTKQQRRTVPWSRLTRAPTEGLCVLALLGQGERSRGIAQEAEAKPAVTAEAPPADNSDSSSAATTTTTKGSSKDGVKKDEIEEEPVKHQAWQYAPYRIRVWVAFDYEGSLTPSLLSAIRSRITNGSEAVAFSTWEMSVSQVPDQHLRAFMLQDLKGITSNQLFALAGMSTVRLPDSTKPPPKRKTAEEEDEEKEKWTVSPVADGLRDQLNNHDKIFLLTVRSTPLGYEVAGREVDTATRHISLLYERPTRQRATIPDQAFGIVYSAFRPVVRLESVSKNGKDATGVVRAGALIEGPDSPSHIGQDDALLPIIRSNDRLGQPKEFNGIRATEWTYLHVTEQNGEQVSMRLHTALRSPLGGRGGSRIQKYGLKVRPRDTKSTVRLISKNRGRPLSGYEIFSRHVTDKEDSVFIGLTNWNGEIEVTQQGDIPVRLMYIKNGGMLLAGIPIVAGHHEFTQAEMRDDETRLQAEAFIRSVQNTILDTVAQRQMISSRIDKSLQEGNRDAAKAELAKYRSLSSLPAVLDLLNRRKKGLSSNDRRMQMQIDLMFEETQELAVKYLDESLEVELNRKVNGGAAPSPAASSPTPPAASTSPAGSS